MDHVMVNVKGLRKKPFFKVVSDYTLFDAVDLDLAACVTYDPDHNLDEDAWFKIEDFSQQPYCIDILKKDFDSKDFDDLPKGRFTKIRYLFSVQEEDFYFQKVTPSLLLRRKFLGFGEVAQIEEPVDRLIINSTPDAVYFKQADTLVFRNLASISSIFRDIDVLYKEATDDEVEEFLAESFIELINEYDLDKVSKPNRKRIGLAMSTLEDMSADDRELMFVYIEGYCDKKLKFDKANQKFEISSDNDLKLLLYGIEQRFYTTPLSQKKLIANSVQPAPAAA